ncbi:substrate-binding periplasmic protein [Curvivirga aplysinae]|uniref:substrate-binding periplasmic protein n=1 Tax=Curvivirga aplysinae TaxID=2529852 RepID=UPI0012BBF00F|nr:ABC transporter substrate-binding protein [Curvivirga aplysinae]MTI11006.1 amino acid ABC transporter substrate-binding protein [Curvivirga aplysinae]
MQSFVALLGVVLTFGIVTSAQAETRIDIIKKTNILRVCIWPEYFAISYRNPRTYELEGVDVDMARELAGELNVELNFVDSSFAKLAENMTKNACDISMHGVGVRESRKQFMDFSTPHLSSGIYAVGMKRNKLIQSWEDIDQIGNVVVVQRATYMEPVMRDYLKKAELSVVESFKAREQDVEAGRADVFMTDYPYGHRMSSLTNWALLMAPEEKLAVTPYAFALPKGEPDWLKYVNNFVASIKADGRLKASAIKHGLLPIVAP